MQYESSPQDERRGAQRTVTRSGFFQNGLAFEKQAEAAGSCVGLHGPLLVRWNDRHRISYCRRNFSDGICAGEGAEVSKLSHSRPRCDARSLPRCRAYHR